MSAGFARFGRIFSDGADDPLALADALAAALPASPGTVLLFASPELDIERFVVRYQELRPQHELYGASSSGFVAPEQAAEQGLAAAWLGPELARMRAVRFEPVEVDLHWAKVMDALHAAERELGLHNLTYPGREGFLLLCCAGMQQQEEYVSARLHLAFPDLPLVGGTASDGMRFRETWILDAGTVYRDCNLALVVRSERSFRAFEHHHFQPGDARLVVTGVDPGGRRVTRLSGRTARQAYADLLGISAEALDIPTTVRHPFGVRIGDRWFLRSVYRMDGDALVFASAMEAGTVLAQMNPMDQAAALQAWVAHVGSQGYRSGILFNCLGRFVEAREAGKLEEVAAALDGISACGPNTYGEQYMGMHLNHTLTGVLWSDA